MQAYEKLISGGHRLASRLLPGSHMPAPDRRDVGARETLLQAFRSEMRHAPGLALTPAQAARLFNIQQEACERLVEALAREGLIEVRQDGRFVSKQL